MKSVAKPVVRTNGDIIGCIDECVVSTGTVNDIASRAQNSIANAV